MSGFVFAPGFGGITSVTNDTSATAAVVLPVNAQEVMLHNTSATATVYVTVTPYTSATAPAGTAPTTTTGYPIGPNEKARIFVGSGGKVIRTIASAVDGAIVIVPGNGR